MSNNMIQVTMGRDVFLELVRLGLFPGNEPRTWGHGVLVEWDKVCQLAEEQSVIGLVVAGIENVNDSSFTPQTVALQLVGQTMQIEQQNKAMNVFVAELIEKLQEDDIYAILVKGQGIAQCYERPLWRTSGDVDLLLDAENYEKAKKILAPLADSEESEVRYRLHKTYLIGGFVVELHGNMRGRFLRRVDRVVDEVQKDTFEKMNCRSWHNGETDVLLPSVDEDVIYVFVHILQHFFVEGIGLRQICDWCRLLYTYKDSLNRGLLEARIKKMGIMTEWKSFGAMVVENLGMPKDAMPFYDSRFRVRGLRVMSFILETGNFGHNRHANETYKYPVVVRKAISFCRHTCDGFRFFRMFPLDAVKIWFEMIITGVTVSLKGK